MCVWLDYGPGYLHDGTEFTLSHVYIGRLIGISSRDLLTRYDVKKRKYIGNTTFDAELSLVTANMTLASRGKLVYDPFVGTGSFLLTCAEFGAYTLGSDIDGRQMRGKGDRDIPANVKQYGLEGKVLGGLTFDLVHHPWRRGEIFDAIVTDRMWFSLVW